MLVRILSNIASFLGNSRNRTILVSCLVLTFATSSVVGILAMNENRDKNAATADNTTSRQQEDTIWLRENKVENKNTLEEDSSVPDQKTTPQKQVTNDTPAVEESTEVVIRLNSNEITLNPDTLSTEITAGVAGDSSENTWELTLSSKTPELKIANSQTSDKILTFQLQTTTDIKPGQYLVTVEAVNAASKKITASLTVTVPQAPDAF